MVVDGAESRAADGVGMGEGWQATDEDTMWAEGPPPWMWMWRRGRWWRGECEEWCNM